ncbi:MAG TPA: hypothetical protein IAA58_02450 [Candidatus Gallacutalibacter stercoravium]|nr:hypothetical protein [Candidatus Gallacutalibacter stercoravium]
MVLNPIITIIPAALALFCLIFCLLNKPKKPIMSLALIVLLAFYLGCTFVVDNTLTPQTQSMFGTLHFNKLLPYIFANGSSKPSTELCETAFYQLKMVDIFLFVAVVVSLAIEIWHILLRPVQSPNKRSKKS